MTQPELSRELVFDRAGHALVAERASACGNCSQSGHCASSVLTRTERFPFHVPASQGAAARYTASFPAAGLLALCALVFPCMALLLLAGAMLVTSLVPDGGDLAAAAGALAGLLVGVTGLKLYDSASGSRGLLARLVIVPSGRGSAVGS
ncbi:MAG: hypothetical protein HKN56_07300 [Gammaproteobacteria bacterium]|nr:hypothetical protein [Gammaproteobacteria bacterium]